MSAYEALCVQIERDIERLNRMSRTWTPGVWDAGSEREQLEGAIEVKVAILQGLEQIDSLEFPEADYGSSAELDP